MKNSQSSSKSRKTVLITGASVGIGAATARLFAENGYDLIVTGYSHQHELNQIVQYADSLGRQCHAYSVDFSDSASIDRFLDSLDREQLHFNLLINNAGISRIGLIQDTSADDWNALFQVNVAAVYRLCQYAVKKFLSERNRETSLLGQHSSVFSNGSETSGETVSCTNTGTARIFSGRNGTFSCPGKILNVSSVWGVCGASCEAAYSATKGAVNSFTKALARELAPSHIPVNAVAFGAVDTAMNGHLSEEDRAVLLEEIPAGRMATPQEAAEIIWQMAGFGDYVTGQILVADGGWT
ncbi:MAG: SDR family oxidoreductase [Lachnospiraceae bacterium]|nr:SDR family oxidoreductase [Lachnospiraceae bacterium]